MPETLIVEARIESLDHDGRGVARFDGKPLFIEGALPGERVQCRIDRHGSTHAQASLLALRTVSAQRVAPRCEYFGLCGGCSMQHLDARAQTAVKQRVLEDALQRSGGLKAECIVAAIHGPAWRYRFRARLAVRRVDSKGGVRVGFHQRRSSHVLDMRNCPVLPTSVSALLPQLRELIAALSIADRLPQIEIAVSETATVFVFRNLLPFSAADVERLLAFGDAHQVFVWQQPGGPDSATPLRSDDPIELEYTVPEFALRFAYRPTDFTQVNTVMNQVLIRRALQLLAPQPGERIADLFCGLGNFSLPIARCGASVVGVEGSETLVERAIDNARRNRLRAQCSFHALDLFDVTEDSLASFGHFDRMLIDPPREGAIAVVKALGPRQRPARIVYVSCNPLTLARDAAVLVHEKGYRLRRAGVVNMFPHTSHVESIAAFDAGPD